MTEKGLMQKPASSISKVIKQQLNNNIEIQYKQVNTEVV